MFSIDLIFLLVVFNWFDRFSLTFSIDLTFSLWILIKLIYSQGVLSCINFPFWFSLAWLLTVEGVERKWIHGSSKYQKSTKSRNIQWGQRWRQAPSHRHASWRVRVLLPFTHGETSELWYPFGAARPGGLSCALWLTPCQGQWIQWRFIYAQYFVLHSYNQSTIGNNDIVDWRMGIGCVSTRLHDVIDDLMQLTLLKGRNELEYSLLGRS